MPVRAFLLEMLPIMHIGGLGALTGPLQVPYFFTISCTRRCAGVSAYPKSQVLPAVESSAPYQRRTTFFR